MTRMQLKRDVEELRTLAANRDGYLAKLKEMYPLDIYTPEHLERETKRRIADFGVKFAEFSRRFVGTCGSVEKELKGRIEARKPADYELKLSNMLSQLNALTAKQIKDLGGGLVERLAVFKDDPLARNAISGIVGGKDPYLAVGLFDTTTDRMFEQLAKAKKFIGGDTWHDNAFGAASSLDMMFKGLLYDVPEPPAPLTYEQRAKMQEEINAAMGPMVNPYA